MAFCAQAFRNNPQLQQFVLTDVTPTGRVLGTGSYGSVEEVSLQITSYLESSHSTYTGDISTPYLCWQEAP